MTMKIPAASGGDMSDLTAAWPNMTPSARRHAMRARTLGTDRTPYAWIAKMLGLEWKPAPPSSSRVARRALVLAAVVARAFLDQSPELATSDKSCEDLFARLKGLGIAGELEATERAFLKTRIGRTDKGLAANFSWRAEGLAVLAWALNRFTLPPYDQVVNPIAVQDCVGFANPELARELMNSGTLLSTTEIDRFATHATLVSWRLRTFRMYPGPWDFVGHLRKQAAFHESWLDDLRLLDGDLAIGNQSIFNAPAEEVERCERMTVERQIAAYWLQGDDRVYSKVDPATLLSAC